MTIVTITTIVAIVALWAAPTSGDPDCTIGTRARIVAIVTILRATPTVQAGSPGTRVVHDRHDRHGMYRTHVCVAHLPSKHTKQVRHPSVFSVQHCDEHSNSESKPPHAERSHARADGRCSTSVDEQRVY